MGVIKTDDLNNDLCFSVKLFKVSSVSGFVMD